MNTTRLSRDRLTPVRVLSRGGWGNPDVLLVRSGADEMVLKDFSPRPAWIRHTVGRWITRRELRAYEALDGVSAVPRVLGRVDAMAFVLEYRPGEILSRSLAGRVPADFVDEVGAAIGEMHARGVVHLDLRHRSNVLAGADGRPVLLDFASAICFRPGGLAARYLLPCLAWIDRRALDKWEARLRPPPAAEASSAPTYSGSSSAGSRGANRDT